VRTPCTERWLGSASARVSQLEAGRGPRDRWIEIRGWGGIAQNRRTREAVAQVIRACICPPVESLVPRPATGELASQRRAPFLELKLSGFLASASLACGCGKPGWLEHAVARQPLLSFGQLPHHHSSFACHRHTSFVPFAHGPSGSESRIRGVGDTAAGGHSIWRQRGYLCRKRQWLRQRAFTEVAVGLPWITLLAH